MTTTTGPVYSYDEVPYPDKPYPQTHPDRLATVGMLFGIPVQPIDNCRVLELGCGRGGNLIPMAEQIPGSRFVGVELSQVQVAEARQVVEQLGLANIEIRHCNIMDVDAAFGQFDYIICHGVFSWVPREVQDKMLDICAAHLKPHGIAYVSYNVYPGWHMRKMIRDMICYHTGRFREPRTRIQEARAFLDFLAQNAEDDSPYGKLLKSEAQVVGNSEDGYLYHEHLEEFNLPCYFFQFAKQVQTRGLQYLGEADLGSMWSGGLPPAVSATLDRMALDLIQMEQYLDFVQNRMFRQTLLCRKNVIIDRALHPDGLDRYHVASPLVPAEPEMDLRSPTSMTFKTRDGEQTLTTNSPLMKSALVCLADAWPGSLPFAKLLSAAYGRANVQPMTGAEQLAGETFQLGKFLLQSYLSGVIEFHCAAPCFSIQIGERPAASRLARLQAETATSVTNLRHESLPLNELARHLLRHMDGTRDRMALVEILGRLVQEGVLVPPAEEEAAGKPRDVNTRLAEAADRTLEFLARNALLCY